MHAQRQPSVSTSAERAIRSYIENGAHPDPLIRFELKRLAMNAAALAADARRTDSAAVPAAAAPDVEDDSDPSQPRILLGGAAVLMVWGFVAWAGAPLAVRVVAWVHEVLA